MISVVLPISSTAIPESSSTETFNYTQLSDLALANLGGKNSDPKAFEELYRRHHRQVYSLCLRRMHNPDDAEDLTQEVFIQVHRKLSSFRGDAAFTTWLYRLTVNQVLMHYRKAHIKKERQTCTLGESELKLLEKNGANFTYPDQPLLIKDALRKLADGYLRVYILHDVMGYEHEEVSEMLGIKIGTSKSQLFKARLRLRKLVETRTNPKIYTPSTDI